MDVVREPTAHDGLTTQHDIPLEGLRETLSAWTGQGYLWNALGAISPEDISQRNWTEEDIRKRAHRVLFEELTPYIASLPSSSRHWLEALPAETERQRIIAEYPVSGTLWTEARRLGWPPRAFPARVKSRAADSLLLTSTRWTLDELTSVWDNARSVDDTIDASVVRQMAAASEVLDTPPMANVHDVRPMRGDLRALRTEGSPWATVASLAEPLIRMHTESLTDLAMRLIVPQEDLHWRLFHLGVFGEVILSLQSLGCELTSETPLGMSSNGPAYKLRDSIDREWELWFEAGGVWKGNPPPYTQAVKGLKSNSQPLRPDILLLLRKQKALVIECKYSDDSSYIASGYAQAVTYCHEIVTAELAEDVTSIVVGPEAYFHSPKLVSTDQGSIGLTPPSYINALVPELISS